MSNNQIQVVKFLFKDDFKSLKEALKLPPGYEVEDIGTANDLATYLSTIPAGLIIASLRTKDDLVQIATYMKLGKKLAKDCATKVVVINFSGDRSYEKAIAKLGILDLVEPSINTKALKFKLDFWMKSLTAQAKLTNKGDAQKVLKNGDQNKGAEKKPDPSTPVWSAALELEDDIWIIKNENEIKKILGKWLIRIVGPSPYIGQWLELKAGLWRFDIKESEKDMFVPNEGAWYYSGDQKPDFVWKENNWLITGENFDLFFKNSGQVVSRLKSKEKVLTVCKNSLYAKTKEQIIIESFDKDLVFKKEAENLENLEGEGNTDKTAGNLEGKNKTDQLEQSNLEGKTKTGADKSGNLKGKVENQEAIDNENLSQDANNSREKTHWNGKNEYEQQEATDLDLKGEKARESKNLDAKNETDHEKYYKNHNETKQYGKTDLAKNEKSGAEYDENQAEDLKGRSSTDDIQGYYDNKKKSKDGPQKDQHADELSGKTETEKLKSHYGKKQQDLSENDFEEDEDSEKSEFERKKAQAAKKDRQRSESEEDESGDYSGKSSTDKISGHYSGSKDSAEKEKKGQQDRDIEEIDRLEKQSRDKGVSNVSNLERSAKEKAIAKDRDHSEREDSEFEDKSGPRKFSDHDFDPSDENASDSESLASQSRKKSSGHSKTNDRDDQEFEKEEKSSERKIASIFPIHKASTEKALEATKIALNETGLNELTSEAKVISSMMCKGKKIQCELNDFFDDTIIFLTEERNIEVSAKVQLDLVFKFMERDKKLNLEGSVTTVDGDGEGNNYVTVQLTKEQIVAFDVFMRLYETRQSNVNDFIKKAKGL